MTDSKKYNSKSTLSTRLPSPNDRRFTQLQKYEAEDRARENAMWTRKNIAQKILEHERARDRAIKYRDASTASTASTNYTYTERKATPKRAYTNRPLFKGTAARYEHHKKIRNMRDLERLLRYEAGLNKYKNPLRADNRSTRDVLRERMALMRNLRRTDPVTYAEIVSRNRANVIMTRASRNQPRVAMPLGANRLANASKTRILAVKPRPISTNQTNPAPRTPNQVSATTPRSASRSASPSSIQDENIAYLIDTIAQLKIGSAHNKAKIAQLQSKAVYNKSRISLASSLMNKLRTEFQSEVGRIFNSRSEKDPLTNNTGRPLNPSRKNFRFWKLRRRDQKLREAWSLDRNDIQRAKFSRLLRELSIVKYSGTIPTEAMLILSAMHLLRQGYNPNFTTMQKQAWLNKVATFARKYPHMSNIFKSSVGIATEAVKFSIGIATSGNNPSRIMTAAKSISESRSMHSTQVNGLSSERIHIISKIALMTLFIATLLLFLFVKEMRRVKTDFSTLFFI